MKTYDIFIGRYCSPYALRVERAGSAETLAEWIEKGYRVQAEIQIGVRLHEIYLVKAK